MKKQPLLCVVGPTASGKTALSIQLAKRYDGEIISADSMQLYRGIHIASAAPDDSEKQGIPHHLMEFLPLDAHYTAANYAVAARQKITDIAARGKMPVLVGGTGLYISTLTENICFAEEPENAELRSHLTDEMEKFGGEEMLRRLAAFDPESAARLHPNNRRRIIRAMEVYFATGKTMTQAQSESRENESPYASCLIGLTYRDREKLYERIDRRVDCMIKNGLVAEAQSTLCLTDSSTVTQAIGHKELYPYFEGKISLDEAVENLKRATRRYAKRQMTWFRRDERIHWIYLDETENPLEEAVKIIEKKGGIICEAVRY